MYTLGIDLHKKSSVWVLIDDQYHELWKESVACHPKYISTAIKNLPVKAPDIKVALEPSCGWRWISQQLKEAGMSVHIANPKKVRLIAESKQKHDLGDARILANLLHSGYFPEAHMVSDDTYALRLLLRERAFLVGLRRSAKNRLHGIATTQGLHFIKGGNPLWKIGKQDIMSGHNMVLKEIHLLIEDLNRRIIPFDQMLALEIEKYPLSATLMTMPGVGILTSLTIIAEVEDFLRFPSAKHLASFAGLVPRQRSSGGKVHFGSITHQGSRMLRTAMVETAMRIRKSNAPELYNFVERLTPVCGAKKARVALGRKLLGILWKMATTHTPYRKEIIFSSSCNTNLSNLDTASGV